MAASIITERISSAPTARSGFSRAIIAVSAGTGRGRDGLLGRLNRNTKPARRVVMPSRGDILIGLCSHPLALPVDRWWLFFYKNRVFSPTH